MENMSQELLREYIREQNFSNPNDILNTLKEMFRDVLQESLEAKMDETLGYGKYDTTSKSSDNSRNGYSKKTIKSELGPVEINIPRDRNCEFEPKILVKHQRSLKGVEDKTKVPYFDNNAYYGLISIFWTQKIKLFMRHF